MKSDIHGESRDIEVQQQMKERSKFLGNSILCINLAS
jgi:hypothetical protein